MEVKVKKQNTGLTPFDKSNVNPLAAKFLFCYPSLGMDIILYIPSDFFYHSYCLAQTFFWYSRFALGNFSYLIFTHG